MTSVCACVFYSNPSSLLYISLASVAPEQAHSLLSSINSTSFCCPIKTPSSQLRNGRFSITIFWMCCKLWCVTVDKYYKGSNHLDSWFTRFELCVTVQPDDVAGSVFSARLGFNFFKSIIVQSICYCCWKSCWSLLSSSFWLKNDWSAISLHC